jgi:hypothetical protein
MKARLEWFSLLARDWSLMNVGWWGRRYNKSLNRSGISEPFIRKTRMLDSLLPARLIPPFARIAFEKTINEFGARPGNRNGERCAVQSTGARTIRWTRAESAGFSSITCP